MIVNAPWYMSNTVIRRDLQTPTVNEEIRRYSSQYSAHLSALYAKWSAYQIPSVIVVFVILVFKVCKSGF
jgi:hypothetical protein